MQQTVVFNGLNTPCQNLSGQKIQDKTLTKYFICFSFPAFPPKHKNKNELGICVWSVLPFVSS